MLASNSSNSFLIVPVVFPMVCPVMATAGSLLNRSSREGLSPSVMLAIWLRRITCTAWLTKLIFSMSERLFRSNSSSEILMSYSLSPSVYFKSLFPSKAMYIFAPISPRVSPSLAIFSRSTFTTYSLFPLSNDDSIFEVPSMLFSFSITTLL